MKVAAAQIACVPSLYEGYGIHKGEEFQKWCRQQLGTVTARVTGTAMPETPDLTSSDEKANPASLISSSEARTRSRAAASSIWPSVASTTSGLE